MAERGPSRADMDALVDGASTLLQLGNKVAALSLLWSAVAIDPTDVISHRRLAAMLASSGDIDAAADEFARYIEFVLPLGDLARATDELSFAVGAVGGHPTLHVAAEKIAGSIRALVPPPSRMIAPTPAAAVPAVAAAAHPWPRLLPKVPFRFCLHPAGDRYWMRLEGGVRGLVPASVRAVDAKDNVVEHRTCLPLAAGQGHAVVMQSTQPLTWTVLTVPNEVAAAFVRTGTWAYRFQAMVGTEWLAVELIDSGCRLRAKAS